MRFAGRTCLIGGRAGLAEPLPAACSNWRGIVRLPDVVLQFQDSRCICEIDWVGVGYERGV